MVFSGEIQNSNGTPLDQDMDGTAGELVEDSYVALVWVVASGQGLQTIWSDLVGTDRARRRMDCYSAPNYTWATGTAAENGITGPSAAADGGPIIAQNLSGNTTRAENTSVLTPTINCGNVQGCDLVFQRMESGGGKATPFPSKPGMMANGTDRPSIQTHTGGYQRRGMGDTHSRPTNRLNTGDRVGDNNASLKLQMGGFGDGKTNSPPRAAGKSTPSWSKGIGAATVPPAPRVVAHTSGTDPASVGSVFVDFSQPMDPAGFSLADITSFTGPSGSITATGFDWIHDSMLRIDFPMQSAFGRRLALALGPQIPDSFAKNLDQDGDGTPGESGQDGYSASFVIGVVVGPLHHFDITGIGATQTLGVPINGITITAKDSAGLTVESFTGTVNFGGTGGFSGTSANFVNGQVTGVSLTPTLAGTNLTLTVDNGAGNTGSDHHHHHPDAV